MHFFYLKSFGEHVDLSNEEKKHIFNVLRLRDGDELKLLNGTGKIAKAVIKKTQMIEILNIEVVDEPKVKTVLYVAPPRKNKMDQILAQCTEVGVWEIQPISTEYSVSLPDKDNTVEKWKMKLIEACKQSGNPFLPKINKIISFETAVKAINQENSISYFGSLSTNSNLKQSKSLINKINWFVGPEGGFSGKEEKIMIDDGFTSIKIGSYIMRVETAAVVGIALLNGTYNF